ncbi:hypothetical protein AcV7_005481 [Taiwanofungus camphoratus]|nr:hypothetical protein AcV7_005481 [Antrodia cinnamomea]
MSPDPPPPPSSIYPSLSFSLRFVQNAYQISVKLAEAYMTRLTVSWDIGAYVEQLTPQISGFNKAQEARISEQFPPLFDDPMPVIKTPVTVVDQHEKILVWHLPDVLSPEHQIWDDSAMLNQVLKSHHPQSEGNWRIKSEYYMNEDQCEQFLPGCINLSPAWFQQGHESMSFNPEVCSVLKKPDSVSRIWLQRMRETSALIGGILSIIHPELYRSGMASLRGMQWLPGVDEVLKEWHSPFNAMSFIANRESLSHRDWKAMACWYDILVTIGNSQDLTLDLEGVGGGEEGGGEDMSSLLYEDQDT